MTDIVSPAPGSGAVGSGEVGSGEVGAVAIGRNEGERLIRCLESLLPQVERVVYVDSGSTDGSAEAARRLGADVVDLDMDQPFTAARARNAGVARLAETGLPDYIQFVDGDCELDPGWIATARAALEAAPRRGVVCGRRRERHPEHSIYNRLIDIEWDTPIGPARACGGDALMRSAALAEVGGFDPTLIAGEEPELCVRLRQAGWSIERLDAEMTLHDAAMLRFGQWWKRTKRGGHAFAEGAARHGSPPERHWVRENRRSLLWGLALPLLILLAAVVVSPWALLLLLVYPLQVARLARHRGLDDAVFLMLGKFAEAQGALQYYRKRLAGGKTALIEYK